MKILKSKNEIQQVFSKKKYFASKYFTVFTLSTEQESKVLITTVKKYGNAVERNRIKRRVKDIVFNSEVTNSIKDNTNYVFVCKEELKNYDDYKELKKQVEFVLKGANKNGFKNKQ